MTSGGPVRRLIVVGGWGVRADMLLALYRYWPGEVVPVSLDDALLCKCDSLSEVVDELLSLYPEPSVWMGWSLGAQVVMEAVARATGSVASAITLGGFPKFVASDDWPPGMPACEFEAFRLGMAREPERYWLHFLLLMINGADSERQERKLLKRWLEKGTLVSHANLRKSLGWLGGDQRPLWQAAAIPVLHLMGVRDAVVKPWNGQLALPAGTAIELVSGMAHWPGGSFAETCWERIQGFTEAAEGRAR
ncbi:MAG TPA: alpha/beta fold hydrolase [Marinobacter sp.]|uniref:alpha/beta fold hydrolase n=1 Tax=Marinobacter sp. TaxID=50741 RepID=UPI002D7E98CC|nr:alpha/beta fold hydrolase [Marinobacter sp.]HET8801144.1 alpha/beta fold hydrolase [Marinobacter sp.]